MREWLEAFDEPACQVVNQDLIRSQWRLSVDMPWCRAMDKGLWEVRTDRPSCRIARVLLSLHVELLVAMHKSIKKTPDDELVLARK